MKGAQPSGLPHNQRVLLLHLLLLIFFSLERETSALLTPSPSKLFAVVFSLRMRHAKVSFSSNAQKNCHFKYKCLFFILLYLFCKTMIFLLQFIGGWIQQMTLIVPLTFYTVARFKPLMGALSSRGSPAAISLDDPLPTHNIPYQSYMTPRGQTTRHITTPTQRRKHTAPSPNHQCRVSELSYLTKHTNPFL